MTAAKKTENEAGPDAAELELALQLAERARAEGLSLTGPGGLLGRLLVGPLTDRPPVGLRQVLDGQRRHHPRMRRGPPGPRSVRGGHAAGDPGLVHQPGP